MMDVTSNALVALYFACQNSKDNPNTAGEVVVFSGFINTAFSPIANAIADTAAFGMSAYMPIKTFYYRISQQSYYVRRKYPDDSQYQDKVLERFCNIMKNPIVVDVGNITERQKNQQSDMCNGLIHTSGNMNASIAFLKKMVRLICHISAVNWFISCGIVFCTLEWLMLTGKSLPKNRTRLQSFN